MPEDFSTHHETIPFSEAEARSVTVEAPTSDGRVRVEAFVLNEEKIQINSIVHLSVSGGKESLSRADHQVIERKVGEVFAEQWSAYEQNIKAAETNSSERGGDPED